MNYFTMEQQLANEDAHPLAAEQMLIVCDGLGGSGCSRHIIDGEENTSAHFAAGYVRDAVYQYIAGGCQELWQKNTNQIKEELEAEIRRMLKAKVEQYGLKRAAEGSAMHLLPTTLAAAVFWQQEERIDVMVLWAGDSRVYLLDPEEGLGQLSCDDVEGEFDAYRMRSTATMCNCICADKDFYLNCKKYTFSSESDRILFCASDGCFDYFSSPMELECFYLSSIQQLDKGGTIEGFGSRLGERLKARGLHDDCTMAGVYLGNAAPGELKHIYTDRTRSMWKNYYSIVTEGNRKNIGNKGKLEACRKQIQEEETLLPDTMKKPVVRVIELMAETGEWQRMLQNLNISQDCTKIDPLFVYNKYKKELCEKIMQLPLRMLTFLFAESEEVVQYLRHREEEKNLRKEIQEFSLIQEQIWDNYRITYEKYRQDQGDTEEWQ